MNLPVAFAQLKKLASGLEESARDCVGIWEEEEDEENEDYGEMKKVADRDGMGRQDLVELQQDFLIYAEWVREIMDNLVDPWRERPKPAAKQKEQKRQERLQATVNAMLAAAEIGIRADASDDPIAERQAAAAEQVAK
jgi:hypothetical protein